MISTCFFCSKDFEESTKRFNERVKKNWKPFCSKECLGASRMRRESVQCKHCGVSFIKAVREISANNFCSRSCAATYNNIHKTKGSRISKLEVWLSTELIQIYPGIDFHFNRKDAINSELDIYIPALKLAFELNGIFHYEPIYGKEKLVQIANNDLRKLQACLEQEIELCVIDVSWIKYFKPESGKKILDIIKNLVERKLTAGSANVQAS